MQALRLLPLLFAALPLSYGAWPDLPFSVSGRDIISASGAKVVYAGVNWPGAADTMLPEGLQYNSISNIVGFIKSLEMNVVRLTYAIEMVDDYLGDSPNQSLQATLINALGDTNGSKVLQQILDNNSQFTAQTTRLEVWIALGTLETRTDEVIRSLTPWLRRWLANRSGYILTTTFQKLSGVAAATMAMHGSDVVVITSRICVTRLT